VEGAAFVAHMNTRLTEAAKTTDRGFPENTSLRIENGEPVLRRAEKATTADRIARLRDTDCRAVWSQPTCWMCCATRNTG
jgi:hypothetical protein